MLDKLSIEIILSGFAILISLYSLYLSTKTIRQKELHHSENKQLEEKKYYLEKKKYYSDGYANELIILKDTIKMSPALNDKIGLLFHKYSKNQKDYLNIVYEKIEQSVLNSLGSQIYWQNTKNLESKIRSIAMVSNQIFDKNVKDNLDILKKLIDGSEYKELEKDFIKTYNEFSKYYIQIEDEIKISINKIENYLLKAKNEQFKFDDALKQQYSGLLNLLNFISQCKNKISINEYRTINSLVEDIVIAGIKLKIIEELSNIY